MVKKPVSNNYLMDIFQKAHSSVFLEAAQYSILLDTHSLVFYRSSIYRNSYFIPIIFAVTLAASSSWISKSIFWAKVPEVGTLY